MRTNLSAWEKYYFSKGRGDQIMNAHRMKLLLIHACHAQQRLNDLLNSDLFQGGDSKHSGNGGYSDGKVLAGDQAESYLMAAFALSLEHAPMFEQNRSQLRVNG